MTSLRLGLACALLCGVCRGLSSRHVGEAADLALWGPVGQLERAVWEPDGYQGTPALRFDGRGAAFVISPQELPMRHTEVGVEFWLKTATLLNDQNILVGQYEAPGSKANSWAVFLDRAGKPGFSIFSSGGTVFTVSANSSLSDGKWHLLRAIYDGKTMRLALDGVEAASKSVATKLVYPRQPVCVGRTARSVEVSTGGQDGFAGVMDDLRLYDRPSEAPDEPAAQFDFNEGRGTTIRGLGAAGSMGFLGRREIPIVIGGKPNLTIVYGREDAPVAEKLRDGLATVLGASLPMAEATQVLEPGTWRLRSEWTARSLLLLGNIHTNRAILSLCAQSLAAANARYPGPGRYEIRALFTPLYRNADIVLVAASDRAGLEAGVTRFAVLARQIARRRNTMPPFLELGGASGPDVPPRHVVYDEFCDKLNSLIWQGNLTAGRMAAESLLAELKGRERGLWGFREGRHYESTRHYCALRQFLAVGALSEEDRARVDERLLQNVVENTDGYQVRAVTADPKQVSRSLDRHLLSSVLGQLVAVEYLDNIANVPADQRADIHEKHLRLRGHVDAFIRQSRFRADREGKEGLDCVSALADLYLRAGDERLVRDGVFRNMADYYVANVDNLGCQAGQDAYITAMPGQHYSGTSGGLGLLAAAYFHRDGQYRWLHENLPGFALFWGTRFRVEYPPHTLSLPDEVKSVSPARYVGLSLVAMEPWDYEAMQSAASTEAIRPTRARREDLFSKAIFRDGCTTDDAYLMLQGTNPGGADGYQGNAIVRFTEFGSLLLFQNTERQSSWARSVVSSSRGGHDPQAAACVLEARFSSPVVSGIRSLFPCDGGVAWRRSVIRRHGGYFVVLDEMTADAADTYHFTCRWRSLHPGETEGGRGFRAVDGMSGTCLRIVASESVTHTLREEPRDGATEPTIWRQFKTARLDAGQRETFQNLVFATNDTTRREFDMRRLSQSAALVNGTSKAFAELAAVGTGAMAQLESARGECRLWYLSENGLAVSGARSLALTGAFRVESPTDFELLLLPGDQPSWIENHGSTPIELTFDCDPSAAITVGRRSVTGLTRLRLDPGQHPLQVSGLPGLFAGARAELARLWTKAAVTLGAEAKPQPAPAPDPWTEAWRDQSLMPPLRKHRTIRAAAEPPTTIGEPSAWVDRVLYYRNEPSAGWDPRVEGRVVLDFLREVQVDSLRLIGRLDAFKDGEMSFEVSLSNDGFAKDVRKLSFPTPRLEPHYAEMVSYMSTYRFPAFVLPVGQRARQARIVGRWRKKTEPVVFYEIEVVTQQRQERAKVELFAEDFFETGRRTLLAASGSQLAMLSPDGKRLWEKTLESPCINVNVADVNSDGKQEVIAFTLAERMHVFNGDGSPRFVHDVRQGDASSKSALRPAFVGAWRPDARRNLEYYFLPHVSYGRVSPEPDLKQWVTRSQGDRGGKYAFTVPDVTGDGLDELAIVGRYGLGFGVLDSRSDLPAQQLRYLVSRSLTGHSSPNNQLIQYYNGAVVRSTDDAKRWLGVVALNPGGVNYFSAPDFKPVWGHFTHTAVHCHCLSDVNADGTPEVLVGREDGYVIQYAVGDGSVLNKTYAGGEVRALVSCGRHVVAGTTEGIVLFDDHLRAVGFHPGGAQSLKVLDSSAAGIVLLAAALENGNVAALRFKPDRPR